MFPRRAGLPIGAFVADLFGRSGRSWSLPQVQSVTGNSDLIGSSFANSPPGMRVGAKASGLFKCIEFDRGRATQSIEHA